MRDTLLFDLDGTLDRLGRPAAHALAFEDSRSGVRSASAAGVPTTGMLTGLDELASRLAGAIAAIRDFRDPWLFARPANDHGSAPPTCSPQNVLAPLTSR
jgi:beta-phosphoglucomutase-like phosphatase (HAD superfamily)